MVASVTRPAPLVLSAAAARPGRRVAVARANMGNPDFETFIADDDVTYTIVLDPASSTDPNYDGLDAAGRCQRLARRDAAKLQAGRQPLQADLLTRQSRQRIEAGIDVDVDHTPPAVP